MTDSGMETSRRRRFLRTLGAVAGGVGLAGCSGSPLEGSSNTPSPDPPTETTPNTPEEEPSTNSVGISFDRTVDIVDQYDADPTGKEPINEAVKEAMSEGTLIKFPEGRYQLSEPLLITHDRVGFVGVGNARLMIPTNYVGPFVQTERLGVENTDPADAFLFKNLNVGMAGPNRSGHMHLDCPSRFYVENVTYLGRGVSTGYAFNVSVRDPNGTGVLRSVTVKQGSRPDVYNSGNGRIGVWAGLSHQGTLRVENCDFREFGNNGLYTGRTPGKVQVTNSYFLNNNVSSVRISGKGSYVEDSLIEVDFRKYDGPKLTNTDKAFNLRGVFIDGSTGYSGVPAFPAGAEVRNCEIRILNIPSSANSAGAINQFGTSRSLRVVDTKIRVDTPKTPAIARARPGSVNYRPDMKTPPKPHWTKLENVVIEGKSNQGEAIRLRQADGSVIRNCRIEQSGQDRDGVRLVNCRNALFDGGVIRTTRFPIVVQYDTTMDGPGVQFEEVPEVASAVESKGGLKNASPFEQSQLGIGPDQKKWYVVQLDETGVSGFDQTQ